MSNGRNNRGLTRFIGFIAALVILVAVTVIIGVSAAIQMSYFQNDDVQTEKPSVQITYQYTPHESGDDVLGIQHYQGDSIHPEQLAVKITRATCSDGSDPNGVYNANESFGIPAENWLQAGNALVIDSDSPVQLCVDGHLNLSTARIELIWYTPDGEPILLDAWDRQ